MSDALPCANGLVRFVIKNSGLNPPRLLPCYGTEPAVSENQPCSLEFRITDTLKTGAMINADSTSTFRPALANLSGRLPPTMLMESYWLTEELSSLSL